MKTKQKFQGLEMHVDWLWHRRHLIVESPDVPNRKAEIHRPLVGPWGISFSQLLLGETSGEEWVTIMLRDVTNNEDELIIIAKKYVALGKWPDHGAFVKRRQLERDRNALVDKLLSELNRRVKR